MNETEKKKNIILELVSSADIENATLKLMDFADDFAPNETLTHEATLIRSKFCQIKNEVKFGETDTTRRLRDKLNQRILAYLDEFKESKINEKKAKILEKKQKLNTRSFESLIYKGENTSINSRTLITLKKVKKKFKLFKIGPINLTLEKGDIIGILGENGSGKTTLLNIIAGEKKYNSGKVTYHFNEQTDWYQIKRDIAYLKQDIRPWIGKVEKTLTLTAALQGSKGKVNLNIVNRILLRLRLENLKNKNWKQLSGGHKTRLELARLLLTNPKVLILDEPLAYLDINSQQLLLKDLKDFSNLSANPLSIIVSSQHIHELESISNKVLFLRDGKILSKHNRLDTKIKNNIYELRSNLSKESLHSTLLELDSSIKTTKWSTHICIEVPQYIKSENILTHLVSKNVSITYFRDISNSTKSLYYDQ